MEKGPFFVMFFGAPANPVVDLWLFITVSFPVMLD